MVVLLRDDDVESRNMGRLPAATITDDTQGLIRVVGMEFAPQPLTEREEYGKDITDTVPCN